MDYNIEQVGSNFRIKGDWPGEVWQDKDGNPKEHPLYKPGDVFVVNEAGWLVKTDDLSNLMLKYKLSKEIKENECK